MKIIFQFLICLGFSMIPLEASTWSITEFHLQHAKLKSVVTNTKLKTNILTVQHASGWAYGDHFFFLDVIDVENNNHDIHGELYSNFSLNKIFDLNFSGPLKDVGITLGYDFSPEVNFKKYIPGIRFDWNLSKANFFKTLVAAYIDDSDGTAFVSPQDDSWIIDHAYQFPIKIGSASFSIEGHVEYVGERDIVTGGTSEGWILSQMQVRYDLGKLITRKENTIFTGIEWQYWKDKLGTKGVDDNAVQWLLVWRI